MFQVDCAECGVLFWTDDQDDYLCADCHNASTMNNDSWEGQCGFDFDSGICENAGTEWCSFHCPISSAQKAFKKIGGYNGENTTTNLQT